MAQTDSTPGVATLATPISGQANTFDAPNFVGELYRVTPRETPFLSLIGGLSGGKTIMSKDFTWQLQADPAPGQVEIQEGADPTYEFVGRGELANTVQIFQYGVEVSYTKLAASQQLGPQAAATASEVIGGASPISGTNPVTNELQEQLGIKLAQMAKDVEYAFLNGTFRRPLTTAAEQAASGQRQTQGILGAVGTTEATAATGPVDTVNNLLVAMHGKGAPMNNLVFMATAANKVEMTKAYASSGYLIPARDRYIAGLAAEEIVTDFGTFPVFINRWLPADTVLAVDLSVVKPVHLSIPGKGTVFTEELAQTGAAVRWQLYGEIGLEYGVPNWHGKIDASVWP